MIHSLHFGMMMVMDVVTHVDMNMTKVSALEVVCTLGQNFLHFVLEILHHISINTKAVMEIFTQNGII